ncbi:hypothetical protein O6H91_22G008900 [Diphasiastrum complanatum]|uniref:Uncharacterized protein n=1 Tax=Diphasiastrum complanatum TaxID=34168 RepID=A0ACC2ACK1_DIPCM|nr:hypothetical protein O6H91_22G008900 [Diphasiastrum complanatum]
MFLSNMDAMSAMMNLHEKVEPWLPPGFRFHPTDEELVSDYLTTKILDNNFTAWAIAEVDLNKCEPWDLKERAKMGERELYFFTLRDRKYPTGLRTNRATEAGYWKATGKDRDVICSKSGSLVGMKKTLVFYRGRAPKGEKTSWIMHEYRLDDEIGHIQGSKLPKEAEWVVCRIFQKLPGGKKALFKDKANFHNVLLESKSSLPALLESPIPTAPTDDPGIDSDSDFHAGHFSCITKGTDGLFSNAKSEFASWNHPRGPSRTTSLEVPQLAAASCNTSDIGKSMMKCPSYFDIYNPNIGQTSGASMSSNNVSKLRQNLIIQESLGSNSSAISWKESDQYPKVLAEQYSNILQRGNLRQCKVEPYVEPVNEGVQLYHRSLDHSEWIGKNLVYEAPHLLHSSCLSSDNPMTEVYEMPATLYKNVASGGILEVDSLWGC